MAHMPPKTTVEPNGATVRDLRNIRGLSVEELADRIGCHPQTLRAIERERIDARSGKCAIGLDLLNGLAAELGVRPASIQRNRPALSVDADITAA